MRALIVSSLAIGAIALVFGERPEQRAARTSPAISPEVAAVLQRYPARQLKVHTVYGYPEGSNKLQAVDVHSYE
jgi:hypothetical protein